MACAQVAAFLLFRKPTLHPERIGNRYRYYVSILPAECSLSMCSTPVTTRPWVFVAAA